MPAALSIVRSGPHEALGEKLEAVVRRFGRDYLETDPLKFVHRYADPRDQEIAGLFAAAFAYGSVVLIFRAVERILGEMGPSPRAFLDAWDEKRDAKRFRGFKHRFHDGRDVALLCTRLSAVLKEHGSLGALFAKGYDARDPHVGPALAKFVAAILGKTRRKTLRFLLSSPDDGSACKRMLLYLRWMIRPADGLDVGIWRGVPSSALLLPLDTHTFRIARYLGLTARNAGDWRAAEEATAALKRFDAADPVRYDFALCRLGILDLCPAKRDERKCAPCDLYEVCRL